MLSIPTIFDLVATVLMNIGLLTVTASVYQMMRGAEMLFAALFAILFLARNLNKFHYGGIGCCVVGIGLVGISSVLSGQGGTSVKVTTGEIILGMALIVMSQAVQAAQITFEDYFMSEMKIAPMKIVGFEGVIGTIFMVVVLLPIVHLIQGACLAHWH
jgi:drug/metabolite transporter (DMT)-like permease